MNISSRPVLWSVLVGVSTHVTLGLPASAPTTAPTSSPAGDPPAIVSITPATSASTRPSTGPATEVIHRGDLSLTFDVPGYLEPVDSFEVRYRPKVFNGDLTIVAIAADGARVKAGDVLLELDSTQIQKQVAAAENDERVDAANLAKAEADAKLAEQESALELRQQQDAVKQAEDTVKWWDAVDGPQMLLRLQLGVKQAQATVDDQTDELDQLRKMYKSEELTNATADIVVKRAIRALELSKTQLEMTRQRAEENKQTEYPVATQKVADALTSARFALQQLRISQSAAETKRSAGLVAARAAFAATQKSLADLKQDQEKMTFNAPFDGQVAWGVFTKGSFAFDPRSLRIGEKISAQQVLLTLLAPQKLRAVGELPEARVAELPAHATASVLVAAFPELRSAGVCDTLQRTPISSQAGAVYPLTVSLNAVDPRLSAGNHVTIHIDVSLAKDALLAPVSAIVGGNATVRASDGKTEVRHVVTSSTDGVHIVIDKGLNDGDSVVLHPEP